MAVVVVAEEVADAQQQRVLSSFGVLHTLTTPRTSSQGTLNPKPLLFGDPELPILKRKSVSLLEVFAV